MVGRLQTFSCIAEHILQAHLYAELLGIGLEQVVILPVQIPDDVRVALPRRAPVVIGQVVDRMDHHVGDAQQGAGLHAPDLHR